MSWNLRDYRKAKATPEGAPPPEPVFDDDLPLPTFAGMDEWDEDAAQPGLDAELKAQGMWTTKELDRFAWLQRRGITEGSAPEPPPPTQRPSWLQRLLPWRTPTEPGVDETRPPWAACSAHEAPPGFRPGGGDDGR